MNYQEPGSLEVFITITIGNLAQGVYKNYIDRLDLKGDEHVLELGPSAGNSTRHLARRLLKGGGCVTAVDISPVWARVASKRLKKFPNVKVVLGDITKLDIPDNSQNVVLLSFVLHEIPTNDRVHVMRHTTAKLSPAGKLFIREPLRFISQEEIRQVLGKNGLVEITSSNKEIKTQGMVYEGTWMFKAPVNQ